MERARLKSEALPEDGIPPELIRLLPHDTHLDNILVQKAATPIGGRSDLEGAGHMVSTTKPNGVVLEKSSYDEADINAQRVEALRLLVTKLRLEGASNPGIDDHRKEETDAGGASNTGGEPRVMPYMMATGNNLVDQFNPWYFGIAFAFLFKYCTGMPDMPAFAEKHRYRRRADAPRIEPSRWVAVMARRIEAQLQRDWNFGFVSWNYVFRSAVNLSRTLYSYENASTPEGRRAFTSEELEDGAISICKALRGQYRDTSGVMRAVSGDMTKIRFVPGLSEAAKRLLQNIEHTSRKIPGTQEVRRVMRFDIQGYRIRYVVPIFVTFSPDEAHNMLMIRLSRTRRNDPNLNRWA